MKIKTTELTGAALDWAVAKALGHHQPPYDEYTKVWLSQKRYSSDWAQGGPIIGRERISIDCQQGSPEFWKASCPRWLYFGHGPTPLIAAMRCFVASKLGDEVEVPDELVKETV